ncbi:MAG: transcription antitermination factor NusB [Prochlorococcus sp. SP3034]|nr:transcription antitermination factor NusB [Prochlorococcus sp. SP3034]|tara:strand:- start:20496 stop:21122 length:627 start_codon:yes stop_codon:yes gene_type:complete
MNNRSLSRELSLISLGLINDSTSKLDFDNLNLEHIIESAVESLVNHCRQELDQCEINLENASQNLFDSELYDINSSFFEKIRDEMKQSLLKLESVMNILSDTLEFPKIIAISDQLDFRNDIKNRLSMVVENISQIDNDIDNVMESWRFKRLPRIDRDILRLAYVDIKLLNTPISVSCNEAVLLANKYSDMQGRKMINGVLRRLQQLKI